MTGKFNYPFKGTPGEKQTGFAATSGVPGATIFPTLQGATGGAG